MKKRLLSLLCTAALLAGLMPTAALAAGTDTGKAIQLVDSGTAANIGGGQEDNIYFGTYQQSSDGSGGYNTDPIKWRVLENADGQLFLLSDQNLDVFQYHTDYDSVTWETSTMRSWLNGYDASHNTGGSSGIDYTDDNFINTAFSEKEQAAIADTAVVNDDNPVYNTEGGNDTTDQIFLLSIAEAQNSSYFADDSSRIATNTAYVADGGKTGGNMYHVGEADFWWLRSPARSDRYAAYVGYSGGVHSDGGSVDNDYYAVRPAFHLDLNSVLFTSAAAGGKSASGMDSGLTAIGDYDGSEWKLTLLDNSRNFAVTETTASGKPGDTITLNYTGATTGTNESISVILADNSGAQYYGRVAQPTATDGTVEITIPSGLADGTYTLYVFSEQYNGDYQTDYASAFAAVSLTIDTTAPTLSNGRATRDSETNATVQFTSDEAGEYYYAVVESGADEPSIDTTGAGTSCISGENTLSLDSLTAGAKDLYIVAKDAAGNVSDKLKIGIPEYIPPVYGISASPAALDFGSKTAGYTEAPAAQTVTITNTGNQTVTINLPASTNYAITAGAGFASGTATLAPGDTAAFTVQPNTGLAAGTYDETLTVSGGNNVSASIELSFEVLETYSSDTTAPTLTPGSATRDSETAATVRFTSDEAGEYYYAVVESGADEPSIDTTGAGTSCISGENTLSLDSLTAGAKDLYIVAKDAAGNVSDKLKIGIPEYIPPVYGISASPAALDFGSKTAGYTEAPAAQTVTITNTGNQTVTVNLPASTNYTITAGAGFASGTATLAPGDTAAFTVQPNTGLAVGDYAETLTISGSSSASASISLAFLVEQRPSTGGGGSSRPTPTPSQQAIAKIKAAKDGETVTITLPAGKTTLDKEVFEELAGRDVTLELDLGDGVSWTIHGLDIPADAALTDLDMGVAMDTDTVPVDLINAITGEVGTLQLTLAHDGEFGFTLTLTAPLGEKNAGYWANLYYFDEDAETLTFQTSAQIDADGTASLVFTYASQYVIVIDDRDHTPKDFPFVDVSESDWFYEAVDYVFQRDLMNGTDPTHFTPNGTSSRAMVATILWRMAGQPQADNTLSFTDIPASAWYTEAVRWAAETGIVTGYSDTKFGPDDPVTREQFAAMLYRYARTLGEGFTGNWSFSLDFPDADQVSEYAYEALCWLTMENVLQGMEDGNLHPQGTANRAQLATMLQRFCQTADQ